MGCSFPHQNRVCLCHVQLSPHYQTVIINLPALFSGGDTDVTFEELLAFITGADRIPPCGYLKKMEIQFYEDQHLPYVSTCALTIYLHSGEEDCEKFADMMKRALRDSIGFDTA